MGDTGSLALGGALGAVAILLKSEFLLVFVGAVFVAETVSVILQRFVFKYRKQRYGLEYAQSAPRLSPSAAASSLRGEGVERAAGRRAVLDHRDPLRLPRAQHAQAALSMPMRVARPSAAGRLDARRDRRRRSRAQRPRGGAAARARRRRRVRVATPARRRRAASTRRRRSSRSASTVQRRRHDLDAHRASGARRRQPGVPPDAPPLARGARGRRADRRARSRSRCGSSRAQRYIAITGTNGKTTTTALTRHLLEALGYDARRGRQHRHAAGRGRAARRRRRTGSRSRCRRSSCTTRRASRPRVGVLTNLSAEPPRPVRQRRRVLRRQGAAVPERDGRVELGDATPTIADVAGDGRAASPGMHLRFSVAAAPPTRYYDRGDGHARRARRSRSSRATSSAARRPQRRERARRVARRDAAPTSAPHRGRARHDRRRRCAASARSSIASSRSATTAA